MHKAHAYLIVFLLCNFLFYKSAAISKNVYLRNQGVSFRECLESKGSPSSIFFLAESGGEEYDTLNFQWNMRLGNVQPLAILTVNNVSDVSNGVRCGTELGIRLVAKSGGHSYEKYSFGDENTVVVDLRNLADINIDPIHQTADVGTGILLSHLYSAVWFTAKLGMAGGSCIGPGAGHTLGAGYGYFSKRFGLALDNVLEMEMVDRNGDLQIASETSNPDLFWALRGAGAGNFGIVTRIKYQLFDASNMKITSVTIRYYDIQRYSEVLSAWDSWNAANHNGTAYTGIVVGSGHMSVSILDLDMTDVEIQAIRQHFPAEYAEVRRNVNFIEYVVLGSFPATEATDLANVKRENHPRYPFRAKSYFGSKLMVPEDVEELGSVLRRVPMSCLVRFSSYGGAINRVPKDATAFVHRNSLYNIQVEIMEADDPEVDDWVRQLDRTALAVLDNGESYQSYSDGELEDFLVRYYGSNLPRLVELKNRYDPSNYFNFPQSIPLAI